MVNIINAYKDMDILSEICNVNIMYKGKLGELGERLGKMLLCKYSAKQFRRPESMNHGDDFTNCEGYPSKTLREEQT